MLFFYAVHVYGTWKVKNYRPDPETTSTVLLHNTCAVFGQLHTLRPNTDVSGLGDSVDGTKLGGSFMNFTEGHIAGMVILAIVIGVVVFVIRNAMGKNRQAKAAM